MIALPHPRTEVSRSYLVCIKKLLQNSVIWNVKYLTSNTVSEYQETRSVLPGWFWPKITHEAVLKCMLQMQSSKSMTGAGGSASKSLMWLLAGGLRSLWREPPSMTSQTAAAGSQNDCLKQEREKTWASQKLLLLTIVSIVSGCHFYLCFTLLSI